MKNPAVPPCVLVAALVSLGSVQLAAADLAEHLKGRPTQYSCDETITGERGGATMHVVQDGEKLRTEVEHSGNHMISIMRRDQQKMYMLMVDRKMLIELPYDAKRAEQKYDELAKDPHSKVEVQPSETIRDIVCDKFQITRDDAKKSLMWISQKDHTMVRWSGDDGKATVDFTNYRLGPPDAALFEPPADYQKLPIGAIPPPGAGGRPAAAP